MKHAHDFNPVIRRAIKYDVTCDWETSQPRRQFFTLTSQVRHSYQNCKTSHETRNQSIRGIWIILSHVKPYLIEVSSGCMGDPALLHSFGLLERPFNRDLPDP